MKAKCYNCGKIKTYQSHEPAMPSEFSKDERDIDGLDIFLCGSIRGCRFKIDMKHYMKNRHKKDFIIKTVSADNDYSAGFDKRPKKIKRSLFTKVKRILG